MQTKTSLKNDLLQLLQGIEQFQALPSKVAGGTALFYKGKEFAHFHSDDEIDLRLTKSLIRSLGLSHPPRSVFHPTRAASSNWIEVRFNTLDEVMTAAMLVHQAVSTLRSHSVRQPCRLSGLASTQGARAP